MLPESLKNAFQLYKRDTNAIATWLANTANKNGHSVHKNNKETQAYLLRLRDFIPLATFIAAVKPQVHVPLFMSVTIDRVIEVRRTVCRIMGTKDDIADEESDVSHLHFVGVLEQVRDILKQQMQIDGIDISSLRLGSEHTGPNAGVRPIEENNKRSASQNPFDILNLYETNEQAPDSVEAVSSCNITVEYEPESHDKYEEACLAFMSLLKAVLHQRQKVRELWHNYKIGNVFLGPTAIGTNEAIEICRRMEGDVASVINKGSSVSNLVEVVFKIMCQLEGQDLKLRGRNKGLKSDTYDIASLTMWNVSRILHQFMSDNNQDRVSVYNGSSYNETMDRASSTNKQKYSQDEMALTEILSDIRVFGIVSDQRTIEDEFTRSVHTLLDTNKVTLWQCFAAQIYLDTLHELHGNLDLAWSEMAGTNAVIKSSLASALEEPGDVRLVENWRDKEESLKEMKWAASEWESDPIARYKTEHGFSAEPNQFLRRHPLYCGVWVHEMRTRFHEAGVNFASAFGYVHQTYQLYHALQREGLLGAFAYWMDMMTLFETQGHDTFFTGSTPITVQEHLENLCLKSGLSATDRARGKGKSKGKKTSAPDTERGRLKELGALSMLFKKRFSKTSRREMTAEYLQKIIESNGFHFVQKDDGAWDLEKPKAGTVSERATTDIPATHIITCVTMAMRSEAHQLAFNLFLLHMDCLKILEEICKTIDEQTMLRLAPEPSKNKELPAVVTMVLRDAAADKPQGLLQRAASVVSKHLLEPSSMASTLGMRDLGFQPCRCPQNTARGSAATRNCMNLKCGKGL
ncbi:hypothetical protein SLS64_003550 [Diaporthe eres]|uniref:DUF6604 domain-containing protein n=1 Tax=Diaporthe eres TaxID=83184 RepID=A0ABR1PCX0_DIAER